MALTQPVTGQCQHSAVQPSPCSSAICKAWPEGACWTLKSAFSTAPSNLTLAVAVRCSKKHWGLASMGFTGCFRSAVRTAQLMPGRVPQPGRGAPVTCCAPSPAVATHCQASGPAGHPVFTWACCLSQELEILWTECPLPMCPLSSELSPGMGQRAELARHGLWLALF